MIDIKPEHATLNFRWTFRRMLSSLPFPGTPFFADLVKELGPYKLASNGIYSSRGSNNLADVALTIWLLDGSVQIRLSHAAIDINVNNLTDELVQQVSQIADAIFTVLHTIDSDSDRGNGSIKIGIHFALLNGKSDEFLAKFYNSSDFKGIKPTGIAFKLEHDELSQKIDNRIVFTPSINYDNSIYMELSYEIAIDKDDDPTSFLSELESHLWKTVNIFGLNRKIDE